MKNKYSEAQEEMLEGFKLYLEKCAKVSVDTEPYNDIERIDECLKSEDTETSSISDYTNPEEFDEVVNFLNANDNYQALVENQALYADVLKKYREYLVVRKFTKIMNDIYDDNAEACGDGVNRNIIYFGAPGTGKSHTINTKFPDKTDDNSTITIFHPDSDYATFVGCYKPTKDNNGELTYNFVAQPFIEAYLNAWLRNDTENYYLVIEEINRGNCAQIFGDIFQLLDRDVDGTSTYKITPDSDLQDYLKKSFEEGIKVCLDHQDIPDYVLSGRKMQLPPNLWILATMNTSDQSLFPMDSAFKRRWAWRYVPIKDEGKDFVIDINGNYYDWWDFLNKVNDKIAKLTMSEDKQLGYWFVKVGRNKKISAETFVNKVLFYLWSDVFKDYANDGASPFTQKVGKEVTKQTFRSFVKNNGRLNYEEINRFLQHGIDVSPIENYDYTTIVDNEAITTGASTSRKRQYIRVRFSDGRVFENNNASQVLKDVIEEVGIERVRELGITHSNAPLISISLDEIPNKAQYRTTAANHRLENGMYLFTTTSNAIKKDDLERIARELEDVNYTVELYTKE